MKLTKRILALALALLFILPAFAACSSSGGGGKSGKSSKSKGYSSAEECAEAMMMAKYNAPGDFWAYFPKATADAYLEDREVKSSDFSTAIIKANEENQKSLDNWDVKIKKVEAGEPKDIDEDELEYLNERYDINAEEVKKIRVTLFYTQEGEDGSFDENIFVVKIDGKWYASPQYMSDFYSRISYYLPEDDEDRTKPAPQEPKEDKPADSDSDW